MSVLASEVALRDYLLSNDDRYRELANEHRKFEARLTELASLHYPNEDEKIEETIIKKKKLLLKDQMEVIASKFKTSVLSH